MIEKYNVNSYIENGNPNGSKSAQNKNLVNYPLVELMG